MIVSVLARRLILILFIAASICNNSAGSGQATKNKKNSAKSRASKEKPAAPAAALSPTAFLIRDPVVVAELQLNARQKSALAELAVVANESAWKFRDLVPEAGIGSDEISRFNAALDVKLDELLTGSQKERLIAISLQVQGITALGNAQVAERLALSLDQRKSIARLLVEAQRALGDVRKQAQTGKNSVPLGRQIEALRSGLQSDLSAALTSEQRDTWKTLLGRPIDQSKLQRLTAQAPELRDVETWINSEPHTLAKLRGQVIALHFWTFG